MDRAAFLMKAKPGGNPMSTLSGKDKATYLKSLRESQKKNAVQTKPLHSQAVNNTPTLPDSSLNKPVRIVSIPTLITSHSQLSQKIAPASANNTDNDKYLNNVLVSNNKVSSQATGLGLVNYDDDEDEEGLDSSINDVPLNHSESSNSNVSTSNLPSADYFDEKPPAGFFDAPTEILLPVKTNTASIINEGESQYSGLNDYDNSDGNPKSKVQRVNEADEYTESLLAEAGTDSQIPRGFFDDPLADLKARGVDIKKIEKKQEKREDDELKSFLGAIEIIKDDDDGAFEREEEAEENEKLIDEEMMQLNYERKMAILLHRSDSVLGKSKIKKNGEDNNGNDDFMMNDKLTEARNESEINDMILLAEKEAREIFNSVLDQQINDEINEKKEKKDISATITEIDSNITADNFISSHNSDKISKSPVKNKSLNVSVEVEQLLRKKKEDKKRKQLEALASEYNPLDFMDWTARSL